MIDFLEISIICIKIKKKVHIIVNMHFPVWRCFLSPPTFSQIHWALYKAHHRQYSWRFRFVWSSHHAYNILQRSFPSYQRLADMYQSNLWLSMPNLRAYRTCYAQRHRQSYVRPWNSYRALIVFDNSACASLPLLFSIIS